MKTPERLEIVISAGVRGSESHEIGCIEVPIRVAELDSMGSSDVQVILDVDTEELQRRVEAFAQQAAWPVRAPKISHPEPAPSVIMHPHHICDALSAAVELQRVLIVIPAKASIAGLIDGFLDEAERWQDGLIRNISRVNGDERIDLAQGSTIRIVRAGQVGGRGLRGRTFDQAFVPIGVSARFLEELTPNLTTSKVGLITGY